MARLATPAKLRDGYTAALPASQALYERARRLFPDAVTHDNRRMQPFPLYVDRAEGAYKWDVDGHRYVDYWMGHGALLLGHNPPPVARRRTRAGVARHALRRLPRQGGRVGRVGVPAGAERRARALHRVGHRSHPHGRAPRARVHRQAPRREVRGSLPRLARGARGRRASALRGGARGGPAAGGGGSRLGAAAERHRGGARAPRAGRRGRGDHRADRRPLRLRAGAGVVRRGAPRGDAARRRAPDLRRGRHRIPRRTRRSPGASRRSARSDHDGQDSVRRASGRRLRRARGRDELSGHQAEPAENRRAKIAHAGTFNANPLSAAAGVAMLAAVADGQAIRFVNQQAAKLRHGLNEILARESGRLEDLRRAQRLEDLLRRRRAAARRRGSVRDATWTGGGSTRRTPSRAWRCARRSS